MTFLLGFRHFVCDISATIGARLCVDSYAEIVSRKTRNMSFYHNMMYLKPRNYNRDGNDLLSKYVHTMEEVLTEEKFESRLSTYLH